MKKERDRLQREVNEYERRIRAMPPGGDKKWLSPLSKRVVEENETLKAQIALAELYVEHTRRVARRGIRKEILKHLAEVSASLRGAETGLRATLHR